MPGHQVNGTLLVRTRRPSRLLFMVVNYLAGHYQVLNSAEVVTSFLDYYEV